METSNIPKNASPGNMMEFWDNAQRMILRLPGDGSGIIIECVDPPYRITWDEIVSLLKQAVEKLPK